MTSFAAARRAAPSPAAPIALFERAGPALVTLLIFTSVISLFLVSDMALAWFGFNYGETGGTAFEKLHPGTWLALAALLAIGIGRGNPLRLADMFTAYRGVTLFLVCWACLVAYVVLISKAPFTPLIDTFFLPAAVVVLIGWLQPSGRRAMALVLHAILIINALLGIHEYVSGWRLTPFLIGSVEMTNDWRSTALLGHPLANAALTGSYMVALACGGGRDLPRLLRPLAMAVCLVSMTAFGGRSSLVAALLLLALAGAARGLAVLRGARLDLLTAGCLFACGPLLAGLVFQIAQTGFFDQFLERFVNDRGSAQARIIMFNLFHILSWNDLLFGPDQSYLNSVQALEGIEFGIENFWIGFMMTHGILMSVFFFAALGIFCKQLVDLTRPAAVMLLIFYFIVASAAVSLSSKTTNFAMFAAMVLTLMRRDAPGMRRAHP